MDRKMKILQMALEAPGYCNSSHNKRLIFNVPKYESTSGLIRSEIDILLSNKHKLLTDNIYDKTLSSKSDNNEQVQVISSNQKEKKYLTRFQTNNVKKKLFFQYEAIEEHSENFVSSTVDREISSYEDSDDEYIPETDVDTDSDNSEILIQKQKLLHLKITSPILNKNIEISDIHPQAGTSSSGSKYIRKNETVEKQDKLLNSAIKTKKRLWNKKDYCYFCETDVMKFARHISRHHQGEIEVQKILALKVGDRARKGLITKLRNKGNFLKSAFSDNIIPVRKPLNNLQPTTLSTYLPCKYCKGFYKRKFLFRHVKKCPHNKETIKVKINAQSEGQSLFASYIKNDILRKEIFPIMRADEISFTAKTDPLICAVARRYLKSHREKQSFVVASRKMRQLALLLLEIRKKIDVKDLMQALDPSYFDVIVQCTKIISKFNPETETYGAPSLASHMGTELKDCIDVANSMSLKRWQKGIIDSDKLKALKELIANEWRYEVSTIANNDLQQKKWNKPSLIPLAEDLIILKEYLRIRSEECRSKLNKNPVDDKAYKILVEVTYVQLLLLNRRRVGELQRMTITCYTNNINNQSSSEFNNCISKSEQVLMKSLVLMKSFKRVVIRGKRGRGVPVLFTEEMVINVTLILKLRERFIQEKNEYLFATNSSRNICGSKTIYKHVRLAGVKNAPAITSTKLRKHLATMSQVINLTHQDLEQLANFMGHTSDIHKIYYRLPSDVYQMAKVSKLLLLNERGEASKYKGQNLDDIDINLDIEENSDDVDQDDDINVVSSQVSDQTSEEANNEWSDKSQRKKRILQAWTDEQKNVVLFYFKNHIKNRIPPKKNECMQLKTENADVLENKSWEK